MAGRGGGSAKGSDVTQRTQEHHQPALLPPPLPPSKAATPQPQMSPVRRSSVTHGQMQDSRTGLHSFVAIQASTRGRDVAGQGRRTLTNVLCLMA